MIARLSPRVGSFAAYGLAIVLMKGFSLVSIPLVAAHLEPAEYGELDLAVSVIEFVSLCCTFGLAEIMFRFCGDGSPQAREQLRALSGAMLVAAALMVVAVQFAAMPIHAAFALTLDPGAFRLALAAASTTSLVELPLAFLRLRDRPLLFLQFVVGRTLAQIGLMWVLLAQGMGPEAVLVANAGVQFAMAFLMAALFLRENGVTLTAGMLRNLLVYGLPLVLSGLSMFALGSANRWFLAGNVSREELAHFAIATKLALATALVVQPLGMWWNPRRLSVLREPGGAERNRAVWTAGLAILVAGGAMLNLAMPVFARLVLPASYVEALAWLPWLTVVVVLNELVSLSNAGAYMGRSSWNVFAVNASAATLVILLYFLAIPALGLAGAIAATIAAQGFRLAVFGWMSRSVAPVPILARRSLAIVSACLLPAAALPAGAGLGLTALALVATPALALAAMAATDPRGAHHFAMGLRHA